PRLTQVGYKHPDRSEGGVMGRRVAISALGVALLMTASFVGLANAHTFDVSTSLTIDKVPDGSTSPGDRVMIVGKLKSSEEICRAGPMKDGKRVGQQIRLHRVKKGPDPVVDTDR